MEHARLGLSNTRWPYCPGSIREEEAYPDEPGEAAIDGTGSHLLLEMSLSSGQFSPKHWLDKTIGEHHEDRPEGWWVKQDRIDRVQMAIDYVERRKRELGPVTVETESRSNPGDCYQRDDWWGTTDITLLSDTVLEIIDYKDGQMWVSEKNSSQLIGNAIGKLAEFPRITDENGIIHCPIKTIRMTIIQPKKNPVIRYVEMTPTQLWAEGAKLHKAATLTDDPNAPLIHGKHCTWCKHGRAGNCKAKNQDAMKGMQLMSNDIAIESLQGVNVTDMPSDRLSEIKDMMPLTMAMFKQVDEEIEKRLDAGQTVKGYGIGTGKGGKEFIDDEAIVCKKLMGMRIKKKDLYRESFITPAQALKLDLAPRQLKRVDEMIQVTKGKKKVVRSNQVEKPSVEDMFMNGGQPDLSVTTKDPTILSFM